MSMNVGMLACYDQAKEVVAKLLNDPMTHGKPSLPTQIGSSAIAVSDVGRAFILLGIYLIAVPPFFTFSGFHCGALFSPV
jgi:hypothetical protein